MLRTARFFLDEDDNRNVRSCYADANVKANEFLYRRADIEDVVTAHLRAADQAPALRFRKYIISATTPFQPGDLQALRDDAPAVLKRRVPAYEAEFGRRGWSMFPGIGRVYVNDLARRELGWRPRYDFNVILEQLRAGEAAGSPLARAIGSRRYHAEVFADGPYPV